MMVFRMKKRQIVLAALMFAAAMIGSGCGSSDEKQVALFLTNPPLSSETEKMAQINDETRPYRYLFDNPVTLYVSTAPGKPAAIPDENASVTKAAAENNESVFSDPVPVYRNAYRTAFVESGKDEKLWFAFRVGDASASKIVWQVANRPFRGDEADWREPEGLIASGLARGGEGEFSVDFAALELVKYRETNRIDVPVSNARLYPKQEPYYVRAVAVDAEDNAIGTMGRGFEVLYGNRVSYVPPLTQFVVLFDLLTPPVSGNPYPSGEFQQPLDNWLEHACTLANNHEWYFRPEGFPQETETIYLQVTKTPLGSGPDAWRDPPGLVHELRLTKGTEAFDALANYTTTIPIDFATFAQEKTEYYVRAVALSPGAEAGTVKASYSITVKFVCRAPEDSEFTYYPPPVPQVVEAPLPEVRLLRYEPIDWEESDWMYWYEVVRQPTVREYTNGLVPDDAPVEALTPGVHFKLAPPAQDDKSWLEKAWDAVTGFFSNLVNYVAKVTDWVASRYNDIKADLISYVAQNFPGIPPYLRDDLENALKYTVDYGLASVGIPPELPSFDQLSEQGLDYLAANALDMANMPDTDLTEGMVKNLAGGIGESLSDAANSGNPPNPLNWTFVRQYPAAMYRPAYLLVEITNPHAFITPSGTLNGRVYRYIDTQTELGVTEIEYMYSAFGGSSYFELYRPVDAVPIPQLLPGQTITVPIYLQEYTGAAFPFSPVTVSQNDFLRMYNAFDHFTFSFWIDFDLPPVAQYAAEQGVGASSSGYVYDQTGRGFGFTADPAYTYVP